jgi:hypothetical protein
VFHDSKADGVVVKIRVFLISALHGDMLLDASHVLAPPPAELPVPIKQVTGWATELISKTLKSPRYLTLALDLCTYPSHFTTAGLRHASAPGRLTIWRPFKQIFLKLFRPGTVKAKISEGACPGADNFRRNSFACRSLSLLDPYF